MKLLNFTLINSLSRRHPQQIITRACNLLVLWNKVWVILSIVTITIFLHRSNFPTWGVSAMFLNFLCYINLFSLWNFRTTMMWMTDKIYLLMICKLVNFLRIWHEVVLQFHEEEFSLCSGQIGSSGSHKKFWRATGALFTNVISTWCNIVFADVLANDHTLRHQSLAAELPAITMIHLKSLFLQESCYSSIHLHNIKRFAQNLYTSKY